MMRQAKSGNSRRFDDQFSKDMLSLLLAKSQQHRKTFGSEMFSHSSPWMSFVLPCIFICIDVGRLALFSNVFSWSYHARDAFCVVRSDAGSQSPTERVSFPSQERRRKKFLIRRNVSQGNKMPIKSIDLKCSSLTTCMNKGNQREEESNGLPFFVCEI